MLSRVLLVAHRNAIIQSTHLAASTTRDSHRNIGDFQDVQYRRYHIANGIRSNQSKITENVLKSRMSLCLASARNISTTPVALNSAIVKTPQIPAIPSIPDAPAIPEIANLAAAGVEPSFQSLGLGGWWPPGIIQSCLEFLHVSCGLPWWASIVIGTVCVRLLVSPLVIMSQRSAATMNNVMPEMQKIQLKVTDARMSGNILEVAQHTQDLQKFMKEKNINPLKSAVVPLAQAPIFLSIFMAIRQMVNAPVESLETGGILWFENLTLSDPYYALPIITSVTLLATIELGVDSGRLNASNMQNMRYLFRAFPIVIFPFMMNFPAAMLCYWTTSNFLSLLQVAILKMDAVRDFCKIQRLIVHDKSKMPVKKKSFIGGIKESWSNMKLTNELEHRRQLDQMNFERAAQGAIMKTYKYDPTRTRPVEKAKV